MKAIHLQAGFVYFEALQASVAMRHFSATKMDPREILAYLPHYLMKESDWEPEQWVPRRSLLSIIEATEGLERSVEEV